MAYVGQRSLPVREKTGGADGAEVSLGWASVGDMSAGCKPKQVCSDMHSWGIDLILPNAAGSSRQGGSMLIIEDSLFHQKPPQQSPDKRLPHHCRVHRPFSAPCRLAMITAAKAVAFALTPGLEKIK